MSLPDRKHSFDTAETLREILRGNEYIVSVR